MSKNKASIKDFETISNQINRFLSNYGLQPRPLEIVFKFRPRSIPLLSFRPLGKRDKILVRDFLADLAKVIDSRSNSELQSEVIMAIANQRLEYLNPFKRTVLIARYLKNNFILKGFLQK